MNNQKINEKLVKDLTIKAPGTLYENKLWRDPRWRSMGSRLHDSVCERAKVECADVQGVPVFVSEGQLYSLGFLGMGKPGSSGQLASSTAETSSGAASSAAETMPTLREEQL